MSNDNSAIEPEGDPWDQQPGEPKLWFERFDVFRLLGPNRTVAKAYRKVRYNDIHMAGQGQKSGSNYWYEVADKWRWEARADAWDKMRREELEDREKAVFEDGLSFSYERVDKLKRIAQRLEDFILDPQTTRISPYIIEQYRGVLDDIAKERGERAKETRITGAIQNNLVIETQWGRGGSASDAWNKIEGPKNDHALEATIIEEIDETEH